ncbi:class I SAM-dependent methyltransferase [Shewanella sp. NIFS-20-20]|uniref:class I SAM-dependent methyltransferase n=1 Tax=Shewanella sp. NIFS-20-20 TaxID=2853806 RepID=UPI001C45987E|nr:methyltransferase domain-containing protein [Shewanella sp. NIFS-20-20]MBV7314413.1 methyltransferase [Shewanella sp. NIFS-20-20]
MKLLKTLLAATLTVSMAPAFGAEDAITAAVNSDFRQAVNTERDNARHPQETLQFFDIKPDMTVIELWPGAGVWYAEILGPLVAEQGQYIAANFNTQGEPLTARDKFYQQAGQKVEQWIETHRGQLGKASTVTLQPPEHLNLGADNSADRVLTFRNLHNWQMNQQLDAVFTAVARVLKPQGIFGVVEHRGKVGMSADSGYMAQEEVIELAAKHGLVLIEASEINANPKDTKDYPKGVWTLPPRLALGEQDKQQYLDIGESDRMTLKFIKQ